MVESRDEFTSSTAPRTRRELREAEARALKAHLPAVPVAPSAVAAASRTTVVVRRPAPSRKRAGARVLSFLALLAAPALFVGMSIPASAFVTGGTDAMETKSSEAPAAGQSVEVSDVAIAADATRANYTVTSYAELLRQKYGNRSYGYSVGTGAVQWPFPYTVPITDGYGERAAPCRGCSTFHKGLDFVPGADTPIYAIAAGTVIETSVSGSGFGNYVMIEHVIKGKTVVSMYAHMAMNSSPLQVGQTVAVGEFVGLVGRTGVATAPHLHLEIHVSGAPIDPYSWLVSNAAK